MLVLVPSDISLLPFELSTFRTLSLAGDAFTCLEDHRGSQEALGQSFFFLFSNSKYHEFWSWVCRAVYASHSDAGGLDAHESFQDWTDGSRARAGAVGFI